MERLTPNEVLIEKGDGYVIAPVFRTIAYPPGQHPEKCPIVKNLTAVELKTAHGSRFWGFKKAWIGSDLRMHVSGFSSRNEIVMNWEKPEE